MSYSLIPPFSKSLDVLLHQGFLFYGPLLKEIKYYGKIEIKKNPYGDSRTAPKDTDFISFSEATDWHRSDVRKVMVCIADMIKEAGKNHDWTKTGEYEIEFFRDFKAALEGKQEFIDGTWWPMHVTTERHHLLSYCPDDVNIIDVLEMIVDCTLAGLTRSGTVRPVEIDSEILKKAVDNTVELIKNNVELKTLELSARVFSF